jgi:hypothetical protein
MVGGEKFPYTAAGKKKAAKAARKIKGTPVPMPKKDSNPAPKKMAPKKQGLKKQMGQYGKIGRA